MIKTETDTLFPSTPVHKPIKFIPVADGWYDTLNNTTSGSETSSKIKGSTFYAAYILIILFLSSILSFIRAQSRNRYASTLEILFLQYFLSFG